MTPEQLGWLGGYSHRNRPAEGVAGDLWTRALALEDNAGQRRVMVNVDVHIITRTLHREIAAEAQKRFNLREHDLMLIATHTHSGPALPEGFDPIISWGLDEAEMRKLHDAADRIRRQVVTAIGEALGDLRPARLSFGRGEARFGVNRRVLRPGGNHDFGSNPAGVSDPDVPILRVETPEGKPRAVVFTYACHCTTIRNGQEGFYHYHPDYAGVAAEEIERRLPGATAIYATGCAGQIDPQPQGGVPQAELHGRALAAAVIEAGERSARRPVGGPVRAQYREIGLPLMPTPSRAKYVELSGSPSAYRQRHARMMLASMDAGTLPKEMPLPIQTWRFGDDLTLVALAGEVCVDYALRLKKELGADRTWVVGYANEVPAYIPSEAILKEGGYEAGWDLDQGPGTPGATGSILFYGWPAPLAPGVEDRVIGAVHSLLKAD
ncbi:MAG: neutral/alkaline non-lysosomal ceramidase N-terminal domain-containing protein [Bryobacteraceae bacterium]|nr:neutral/alkaline non-lysosomal ceramidase N-terminal domain-containing protein [Bryobacteraceae bacterium]